MEIAEGSTELRKGISASCLVAVEVGMFRSHFGKQALVEIRRRLGFFRKRAKKFLLSLQEAIPSGQQCCRAEIFMRLLVGPWGAGWLFSHLAPWGCRWKG
jgi:hypothetical protein